MVKTWKQLLALSLCPLMALSGFAACGAAPTPTTEPSATEPAPTEPVPTEPEAEAKVLKVLTLGSSSTVDACHMLNRILAVQGVGKYDEVIVGTLYYSGCKLSQHIQFMMENSPQYRLYLSSSANPDQPPKITEGVTMEAALRQDYWDIIFLQAAGGELDNDIAFTSGYVKALQNYVNQKKHNPLAYFGWHFTCVPPTDPDLMNSYPYSPNPYKTAYDQYNHDRTACFNARAERIGKYVFTDETIRLTICSITAVQNACTSYLGEKDLYRDYTHSTDLGRVMTAYVWYCRLMGIEKLEEVKLEHIPKAFLKSTKDKTQDRLITDAEKAIILESVNNALAHPLEITQSQYTQAPN